MNIQKRFYLLIIVLIAVAVTTVSSTIFVLYRTAFEEERRRLMDMVRSQARLLEAVARYDIRTYDVLKDDDPDFDPYQATLSQVEDAFRNFRGFGKTGELVLAKLENDSIVFLARNKSGRESIKTLPLESGWAEPMELALHDKSGTMVGYDYSGEEVMAAYEPVSELNLGIVAKIDLSELRKPFIYAGAWVIGISVALILLGASIFYFISVPIIRENEKTARKYHMLADNTLDVIWHMDLDLRFTYVNPAVQQIFGYTPVEFIGTSLPRHVRPEEMQRMLAIIDEEMKRTEPDKGVVFETALLHKNGREIPVEIHGKILRDDNGVPIGINGTTRDISERRHNLNMLKESEERFRTAFENAAIGKALILPDGRFSLINKALCDILGYEKEVLTTKTISDVTHPDDLQDSLNCIKSMISGKYDTRSLTKRYLRSDGQIAWAEVNAVLIRNADGSPMVFNAEIYDVTEKKLMERELVKSEKLESLGVLAGGIAHDFNNILVAIMGNISFARESAVIDREQSQVLLEAEKACDRARDLTRQLLTFAKGGNPVKKPVNMTHSIRQTVSFTTRGSRVKYNFTADDDDLFAEVDEGQFSQVINNLVLNAIQAMPSGGNIAVHVSETEIEPDSMVPLDPGLYIRASIKDQGIGIPPENIDKIFDPFYTTKKSGNGLGLSSCYSIIKNHNGHIDVHSKVNVGTEFIVYVPSLNDEVEDEIVKDDSDYSGTAKILVIDDEAGVRQLLKNILEKKGYRIKSAESSTAALDMYADALKSNDPFTGVIIDLTLPGDLSGDEILLKLQEIDPEIKAVVSSGYANNPILSNYREHGFIAMLPKPYKAPEVYKTIYESFGVQTERVNST